MSLIGPDDILKVIDQGNDDSVNAVSIKRLISATTGVKTTTDAAEADIINPATGCRKNRCGKTRSWCCRSPRRSLCAA